MEKKVTYVAVNTKIGNEINAAEKIREVPGVSGADCFFGVYGILAKVETDGSEKAMKTVVEDMRKIDDVKPNTSFELRADKDGPIGFIKDKNGKIIYCHPSLQ